MNHSYTAKIIMRKEYKDASGHAPLYLQSFINGKRIVIPLNISLPVICFDQKRQLVLPGAGITKSQADDYKLVITNFISRANDIFLEYRINNILLTPDLLREEISSSTNKKSFLAFIESEIERQAQLKSAGTIKHYKSCITKLKEFKRSDVNFMDIDINFINDYELFLIQKGYGKNYVMLNIRHIRTLLNIARKKGLKVNYPFDKFKFKYINSDRVFLNDYEISVLTSMYDNKILPGHLHKVLGMYLFSAHVGGVRISDMFSIGYNHVEDGLLKFKPQKTIYINKLVAVPFEKEFERFAENKLGYFFNKIAEKTINENLKAIANYAGIKKNITFHTARHTYATGFLAAGGAVEVLKEILGHEDIETTMIYVHISKARIKEQSQVLRNMYKKVI